jgi:hypothetical protein
MLTTIKDGVSSSRLQWLIWAHERRIYSRTVDALPEDRQGEFIKEWEAKYSALDRRYLALMTRRRKRQAEWWSVDLPSLEEEPDWWRKPERGLPHLTHRGVVKTGLMVGDRRFDRIKRWVDLLIPVLALLVALAALLKR